jgi:hypothetical protein
MTMATGIERKRVQLEEPSFWGLLELVQDGWMVVARDGDGWLVERMVSPPSPPVRSVRSGAFPRASRSPR